eukprot:CAMPEP_0179148490 /NCGR_PEP_ID=MMETSP0796-20121207/71864_1 /TAXON_ID=73915 /ORGANISM="Pyrodinium bahamense, Strain pbaha01" /LENGTH=46 /DNA_ID= /DNA_START= /DNA_END= /DNA_ORIENTATION=
MCSMSLQGKIGTACGHDADLLGPSQRNSRRGATAAHEQASGQLHQG